MNILFCWLYWIYRLMKKAGTSFECMFYENESPWLTTILVDKVTKLVYNSVNPLKHIYWPMFEFFYSCSEIDSRQRSVQQTASRFYRHHLQKLASTGRVTRSYKKYYYRHIKSNTCTKHASKLIPPFLLFVDWNRWAFSRWWECHSRISVYKGLPGKFLCLSTLVGKKSYYLVDTGR